MMPRPSGRPAGQAPNRPPGSGEALLGQVAVAVIIVLGAVGFVVWAGAQLAAMVFGDGPMRIGIAAGGQAAVNLAGHASNPKLAWPEPVRAVLPGPFVYWACTTVVASAAAAVVGVAVWAWIRWGRRSNHPLGVKPNAGFARAADIETQPIKRARINASMGQ